MHWALVGLLVLISILHSGDLRTALPTFCRDRRFEVETQFPSFHNSPIQKEFEFTEKKTKKSQSESRSFLASTSNWSTEIEFPTTRRLKQQAPESPQFRPKVPCPDQTRNGEVTALEVHPLPAACERQCRLVPSVWNSLEEVCGYKLCTCGYVLAALYTMAVIYNMVTTHTTPSDLEQPRTMGRITESKKKEKPQKRERQGCQRRIWFTIISAATLASTIACMERSKHIDQCCPSRPQSDDICSYAQRIRGNDEAQTTGKGSQVAGWTAPRRCPDRSGCFGSYFLAQRGHEGIPTTHLTTWWCEKNSGTVGTQLEDLQRQLEPIHTADHPVVGETFETIRRGRARLCTEEEGCIGTPRRHEAESRGCPPEGCWQQRLQRSPISRGTSPANGHQRQCRAECTTKAPARNHGCNDLPDEGYHRGELAQEKKGEQRQQRCHRPREARRYHRSCNKAGFTLSHLVRSPSRGQVWQRRVQWADGWFAEPDYFATVFKAQTSTEISWICRAHSVTLEHDYKSPWLAEQQGLLLQADVQGLVVCTFDDHNQSFAISNSSAYITENVIKDHDQVEHANCHLDPTLLLTLTKNSNNFEDFDAENILPCRKCKVDDFDVIEPEIQQYDMETFEFNAVAEPEPRPTLQLLVTEQTRISFQRMDLQWNEHHTIITYGLHRTCRGRRDSYMEEPTIEGLKRAIEYVWDDFAQYEAEIIHVQQRPERHEHPTFIVLFEPHSPPFARSVPVLQQTVWENYDESIRRINIRSIFHQQAAHMYQLCGMAGVLEDCLRTQCTVLAGFSPVTAHVLADLNKGDLVMIFIPPPTIHLPSDHIHGMQYMAWPLQFTRDHFPMMGVEVCLYIVDSRRQYTQWFSSTMTRVASLETLRADLQAVLPGRNFGETHAHLIHFRQIENDNEYRVILTLTMIPVPDGKIPALGSIGNFNDQTSWRIAALSQVTNADEIYAAFGWTPRVGFHLSSPAMTIPQQGEVHFSAALWILHHEDESNNPDPWEATALQEEDEGTELFQVKAGKLQNSLDLDLKVLRHQVEETITDLRNETFEMIYHFPNEHFVYTNAMLQLLEPLDPEWQVIRYHIYTDGSASRQRDKATWACFILQELSDGKDNHFAFLGSFGGNHQTHEQAEDFLGATTHQPGEAEVSAVIWAMLWTLATQPPDGQVETHIHADALNAMLGTTGTWRPAQNDQQPSTFTQNARALHQLLTSMGYPLCAWHVKAHTGIPGNEAADELAQALRKQLIYAPELPKKAKKLMSLKMLHHAWAAWNYKLHKALPRLNTTMTSPKAPPLERFFGQTTTINRVKRCTIRMATVNALTLADGELGHFEKRKAYECQAIERKWHIIGLQETRARETKSSQSEHYWIYQVAARKGHGGLEIWIAKDFGNHSKVQQSSILTLCSEPRLLALAIRTDFVQIDIIAVYAPPTRGSEEPIAFWKALRGFAQKRKGSGYPLSILGDFNAHVDECLPNVGSLGAEKQCQHGDHLVEMLQDLDMMMPCSFDSVHQGDTHTCHAKGAKHRIDYILVPTTWIPLTTWSLVDYTFDMHNVKEDHHPTCIQMEFYTQSGMSKRPKARTGYDREAASLPQAATTLEKIWQDMPDIPAHVGVDEHAEAIEKYCLHALKTAFPTPKRKVQQPYFDTADLLLIDDRKEMIREVHALKRTQELITLECVFMFWKGQLISSELASRAALVDQTYAVAQEQLDTLQNKFAQRKKEKKNAFFNKVVFDFAHAHHTHDPRKLFQALKPLRPQSIKHRIKIPRPLPGVSDMSQQPLDSAAKVANRWEEHWGALELAHPVRPGDLHPECRTATPKALAQCPSLMQLGGSFRTLKMRKAPGPDGLGAEIFRACPTTSAKKVWPLLFKEFLFKHVPIAHQGGLAVPVYKHKGPYQECQNYRSILLESILGKALSKTWRHRLADPFSQYAYPMQHGARKGSGIMPNLHALRLRMKITKQKHMSGITIFLDLQSAFYATMRALLLDQPMTPALIQEVFRTFWMTSKRPCVPHQPWKKLERKKPLSRWLRHLWSIHGLKSQMENAQCAQKQERGQEIPLQMCYSPLQ